jgi:uncharacterized protein (TIGR02145 family)
MIMKKKILKCSLRAVAVVGIATMLTAVNAPHSMAQLKMGKVTDVSGNTYSTVVIDSVVWMTQNLVTTVYLDSSGIAYNPNPQTYAADDWEAYYKYPNGDPANIGDYGLLYSWGAAFANVDGVSAPKPICPSGWSIPTVDDWAAITSAVIDSFNVQYAGECNTSRYAYIDTLMKCWTPSLVMPGGSGAVYFQIDTTGTVSRGQFRNVNTLSLRCVQYLSPAPGTQTVEISTIDPYASLEAAIDSVYGTDYSDIGTLIVHGGVLQTADFTFIRDSINNVATVMLTDSATIADNGGIPTQTFASKQWLSTVVLPDNTTSIGANAFANCSRLVNADIYNTAVTSIGTSAYASCDSLKYIGLPETLTTIGASAFSGCTTLDLIEIPAAITNIGASAFAGDSGLRYVAIFKTLPPTADPSSFPSGLSLYVPTGTVGFYEDWTVASWSSIVGITDVVDSLDTSIYGAYTDHSNAKGASFPIGTNASQAQIRGLFKFTGVTGISLTMDSVSVSFFSTSIAAGNTEEVSLSLYVVDSTKVWQEGTSNADSTGYSPGTGAPATTNDATWLDYSYDTSMWATAGGDYNATADAGISFSGGIQGGGQYLTLSSEAIVVTVKNWITTPAYNNGWIAIGKEDARATGITVHTREAALAPFYLPRIRIFTAE